MRTIEQRIKDQREKKASEPQGESAEKVEIGRTPRTAAGFFIIVSSVSFPEGGARIRLELRTSLAFSRHLDITTELARDLLPLIQKAAALGGQPVTTPIVEIKGKR